MIDNDQCLPPDNGLLDILAQAGPRQDVIGLPSAVNGDLKWNAAFNGPVTGEPFVSVMWIGTGVMILRNTVWKRMIAGPWFEDVLKSYGELGRKVDSSEDVNFCKQARSAGLDIWASVYASPHLKTVDLTAHLIEKHKAQQH
jgi:hypothetical protein